MSKVDKAGIHVDSYALQRLLKRAQYTMTKTGNGPYYWTCTGCSADYSFRYNGESGVLGGDNKINAYSCRTALALDFD